MQEVVVSIQVVDSFTAMVTNIENTRTIYVNVVVSNDLKRKFSHF
jgi:hypothetical protein